MTQQPEISEKASRQVKPEPAPRWRRRMLLRPGPAGLLLRARREGRVLRRLACQRVRMQVAAWRSGVETAGRAPRRVWLEFRDRLRAFVSRRVSNPADVDDIVQWVFLQLHRSLGGIRSGDRIHAWLYSTARRAIVDYYRSGPAPPGGARR